MSEISEIITFFCKKIILTQFPMEFLKNFNGFEKLFQNTNDKFAAEMHDFGPERGHFGGQS